jgi:hypothetical protein
MRFRALRGLALAITTISLIAPIGCASEKDDDLFGSSSDDDDSDSSGSGGGSSANGGAGACVDADNDGVCDDDNTCVASDTSADVDEDGIPDECDPCGIGKVLALSPIAFYRLGEGVTYTAASLVASGADASYYGAYTAHPGATSDGDLSVELNGDIDCFVMANPVAAFPTTAMTISMWFMDLSPQDTFQQSTLFSYATTREQNEIVISVDPFGSPARRVQVTLAAEDWDTGVVLPAGSWQHVALTWDNGSGEAALYLNGTLEASTTGLGAGSSISGGGAMVLGQDQDEVGRGFSTIQSVEGRLDEVIIYDRALTAEEVGEIYSSSTCA